MKTILKGCALLCFAFFTTQLSAQTNPTPFNMDANGNYSFNTWASTSPTGTYPANMRFHLLNSTNPPVTAVAQSDLLTGFTYSNTSGTRIQGLGGNGIQFQNATTPANTGYTANKLGEAVVGIVTSSRTAINVSWKAQTKSTAGNVMAIRCQYRIGSSGAYQDFAPQSEYVSSAVLNDSAVFNFTLPANLENQTLVQIRWIYYRVSGASSSSRTIRLDDITITSLPSVEFTPIPDVCSNAAAFAITDGSPSGGVYSGTGVVNGTDFDPSVSGTGTFVITYTYTDANGISNNASINVVVSSGACVTPIGLAANSCGATGLMKNSYIYTESAPGAQDYEYEFSGGDLSAPILYRRTNWFTDFNLSWIPQLNYGQTYDVRVRAKVANTWGVFANVCTIELAAMTPVPQLAGTSCGVTGLNLNSYIYTTSVPGAQDYEYRFVNTMLGYTGTRVRGNNYTDLSLRWVSGLRYDQTYDVTVRAKINGVWGSYGPMCQVTLQPFPPTQLTTASCGAVDLMQTDRIYSDAVAGATNYQYRFTPPSGPAINRLRNASSTDLLLQWVPGLTASTIYTVEVRGYAGGQWGPYGDVCTITTSASYGQSSARMDEFNPTTAAPEDSESTLLMYPNPVGDNQLHLQLDGYNTSTAVVEIYDMSGRLVLSQQATLTMGSALVDLNIESLQGGMYLVTIIAGEERITQQLVVDK